VTERYHCPCRRCECPGASSVRGEACGLCALGAHAPSAEVRDHLAAGAEAWARIVPVSLGSSGLSDRQLRQAAETWHAWHATQPCPLRPARTTAAVTA